MLTIEDLQNNIVFLDRARLEGKEAETLVRLKYKLISMRKQLVDEAEQAALPTDPGKPSKPKSSKKKAAPSRKTK